MTSALERGIVDAFAANMTLNTLVAGRVYPLVLPDTNRQFPAVVYQVIDNPRDYTQDGDAQYTLARVQFRFYDTTYAAALALKNAFVDQYSGNQEAAFGSPAVYLSGFFVASESDENAPTLQDSGTKLYSKRVDFIIFAKDL